MTVEGVTKPQKLVEIQNEQKRGMYTYEIVDFDIRGT